MHSHEFPESRWEEEKASNSFPAIVVAAVLGP